MRPGSAQIPLIHCRLRERVISDPLLPLPIGPATGGERHKRLFVDERERRAGTQDGPMQPSIRGLRPFASAAPDASGATNGAEQIQPAVGEHVAIHKLAMLLRRDRRSTPQGYPSSIHTLITVTPRAPASAIVPEGANAID